MSYALRTSISTREPDVVHLVLTGHYEWGMSVAGFHALGLEVVAHDTKSWRDEG